ncbi:MAG: DUF4234 domain-containing protein [Spirochaetes bacterium]|nr:DUF4234 domain-containing protein [Spirochaetota bacterium]
MDHIIPKQPAYGHPEKSKYNVSIPVYLILTLITCGIFNLYWNYMQMEACNYLLNRQEFKFSHWILFSIITCGIYHIFYQYKMGCAIVEIQKNNDKDISDSLPVISCLVTLFGLSIVVDCIHQYEINKIVS